MVERGLIFGKSSGILWWEAKSMDDLSDLVKGRKLVDSLDRVLQKILIKIHYLRTGGGDGYTREQEEVLEPAVLAVRELADLRAKVEALKPYIQHTDECTMVPAVIGHGGVVVHEAKPCTCGLVELQAKTTTGS
ncbi:MAG: hypothetical protein WCW47_03130 [Candidatus Paceibacterota bacterium]